MRASEVNYHQPVSGHPSRHPDRRRAIDSCPLHTLFWRQPGFLPALYAFVGVAAGTG